MVMTPMKVGKDGPVMNRKECLEITGAGLEEAFLTLTSTADATPRAGARQASAGHDVAAAGGAR